MQLRTMLIERIMEGNQDESGPYVDGLSAPERAGTPKMTTDQAVLSLVSDGWLNRRSNHSTLSPASQGGIRPVVAIPELNRTLEDEYFQNVYWTLHAQMASKGVSLGVINLPDTHRIEMLISHRPDPLILIAPPRTMHDDILEIARTGIRVLLFNTTLQGYGVVALDSDNILGPALAINHLADLGHRRIAFVGAYPEDANTVDRLRGFKTALCARGLPYRMDHVFVTKNAVLEADQELTDEIVEALRSESGPTAIFAAGANLALEILGLAAKLGLKVPKNLSLVAYDDPAFAAKAHPALTTIKQPHSQMAAFAADLICSRSGVAPETCTLFNPVLVVRNSTGLAA